MNASSGRGSLRSQHHRPCLGRGALHLLQQVQRRAGLVNHASRRCCVGHLFVVRTDDGLVVKRAGLDASGAWQLVSDNPNTHVWPTRPDAVVVGEVKWAARTFA